MTEPMPSTPKKPLSTADALSFVTDICGKLKTIKRTGWVMRQVPFPESDSDHMHRCAMLALLVVQAHNDEDDYTSCPQYHPQSIDSSKLLKMALTHDLCESLAGDITPFCGVSENDKHAREERAMAQIRATVGDPLGGELYHYWLEYEQQATPEAHYCKDIDKFEMVVQAYEYEKRHLCEKPAEVDPYQDLVARQDLPSVVQQPLRRFFQTTNTCMKTPIFRRLDRELRERREQMLMTEKGGWKVTDSERQAYAA